MNYDPHRNVATIHPKTLGARFPRVDRPRAGARCRCRRHMHRGMPCRACGCETIRLTAAASKALAILATSLEPLPMSNHTSREAIHTGVGERLERDGLARIMQRAAAGDLIEITRLGLTQHLAR